MTTATLDVYDIHVGRHCKSISSNTHSLIHTYVKQNATTVAPFTYTNAFLCCEVLNISTHFNFPVGVLYFGARPPLRSTVVRASARGAGGRGSIPDRVTPKTLKMGGLRFSAWH